MKTANQKNNKTAKLVLSKQTVMKLTQNVASSSPDNYSTNPTCPKTATTTIGTSLCEGNFGL